MTVSPELHVMLAPARAYASYLPAQAGSGFWIAIRRPLFVALIQGVAIAMTATRTVAAPVVISVAICWTATVAIQLAAASILIASAPHARVGPARAIDLLFLGHAPWSLWILGAAAALTWGPNASEWIMILTMVIPAAVTTRIVFAFARTVLGMDRRAAVRYAALHQIIIWIAIILFIATAVALWPRIISVFA